MNILPGVVQNKHRARAHSFRQTHGPTFLMRMENSRNKYSVYNSSICVAVLHRARVPFVAICELVCVSWGGICPAMMSPFVMLANTARLYTRLCAMWRSGSLECFYRHASTLHAQWSVSVTVPFGSSSHPEHGRTRIRMDVSRAHDRRVQTIGMVQLKMPLLRFQKPSRTADRIERRQRSV